MLKWVGGKTQILDKLMVHFPKEMQDYREIFLGGGSVLFAFLNQVKQEQIHALKGRFLMSNADVPLIREQFPPEKYMVKTLLCKRAIHSKNPETKAKEVLVYL